MDLLIDRALEIASTLLAGLVGFYWRAQEKRNDEVEQRLRTVEMKIERLDERTAPKNAI
tara:strand:- start:836 stop:1012 length:177 start_codon:yes stop_codon:yes gene_type:complete